MHGVVYIVVNHANIFCFLNQPIVVVIFVTVFSECIQSGRYGPKCENKCSESCKNTSCIATTGNCLSGCKPGYIGHNCSEGKEQTITDNWLHELFAL